MGLNSAALNDLIENLAFGKGGAKISSCLGLYLSPDAAILAESDVGSGRPVVQNLVKIPLPNKDAGKQSTLTSLDFLSDIGKIAAVIKGPLSQRSWGTKNVTVTLSHQTGLLRYFAIPMIGRQFLKTAVPLEAKKYIPISLDTLSYDYQVQELKDGRTDNPKLGVLMAVCQKKAVGHIEDLLEALDLHLTGIEVAPCSVLRMWLALNGDHGKAACLVHVDRGEIRVVLTKDGLPMFTRELFMGAEAALSNLRKLDLPGCLAFAQKQLCLGPLAQARISGSGVDLAAWRQAVSQELGTAAQVEDSNARLGLKEANWGIFSAVGASLKFRTKTAITLDLGRIGRISDEENQTAKLILAVAGALALWFALGGLFNMARHHFQMKEMSFYQRDETALNNKTPAQIAEMIKGMQAQADLLRNVEGSAPKITTLLKEIVDNLPPGTWLTKILIQNPLLGAGQAGDRLEMLLEGYAAAASPDEERDLIFQFKAQLSGADFMGKFFKDIQPSVVVNPVAQSRGDMNPQDYARKRERRTSFMINAKALR
ncbi:MAG: hypothetical protein A3J74_11440 [Elusimicrobia bacterium RIFCSPHIGHO2_02_FULL_57_9]|nr:MAG: hypothetical protein A3J74_11440 [Elusimicrobia bacterium RIFCSPHIGHO2_02_FULL_57_9]